MVTITPLRLVTIQLLTLQIQNEPINEPINEPVNEPVNEPINEPINEPVNDNSKPFFLKK